MHAASVEINESNWNEKTLSASSYILALQTGIPSSECRKAIIANHGNLLLAVRWLEMTADNAQVKSKEKS